MNKVKRIVCVGHDNEGSARLFEKITDSYPEIDYLLVIGQGLYYKKNFMQSALKMLSEASWIFIFYRFIEFIRYSLTGQSLKEKANKKKIPVFSTKDVNSIDSIARIRQFEPDLLISLFTMQIYQPPVLKIARLGSITSHPSILPNYRGLEVFFWVLANNEKQTGVSVFFLEEKIDAGKVFEQVIIPITAEMTTSSLYKKITSIGGRLLVKAIKDIDTENVNYIPSEGKGSYYGMPDRQSVLRYIKSGRKFF